MKKYLGAKIVEAEPMGEIEFINKVRNEDVPKNFVGRQGYKVVYEDGYVSWSPKDVFEKAYKPIEDPDRPEEVFIALEIDIRTGEWNELPEEELSTAPTEASKFFPFGVAIEELKAGKKVARTGWNGKGMYLTLIQGYPVNGHLNPAHPREPLTANPDGSPNIPNHTGGSMLSRIVMKIAGDSQGWGEGFSDYVPWLASQTDMLAEDWQIVE